MTDVAQNPRSRLKQMILSRLWWTWILGTWYVLSIGPMYWTWHHATMRDQPTFVEAFYRPLIYACEIPPIGSAVNAYIELWVL